MTRLAGEALKVIVAGEEQPGISAYGLAAAGKHSRSGFPKEAWPTILNLEESLLYGPGWEVVWWEIALLQWPVGPDWITAIRATLRAHLDAGSRVAWIGAEGIPFCDPPALFDPSCMSGGVLAWMTNDGFDCPLDPEGPLPPRDDDTLENLRRYAAGLADLG